MSRHFIIVNSTLESFNQSKLSTKRQVLQRILYFTRITSKSNKEAYDLVCDEVIKIWERAFPSDVHSEPKNCLRKFDKFFADYRYLLKGIKNRKPETQIKNEKKFNW